MRRTTPARVPPRPDSLAFEPLEPRELLAADAAADCWSQGDSPVADDGSWTFDDSWIALDPSGIVTGSDGPANDGWWVDDASFDAVEATLTDVVPFDMPDARGVHVIWFFEPLPTTDADVPVVPFLPPPDAVEAESLPIAVVSDALAVDAPDVWCADVVLCAVAADTATDVMSDTASDTVPEAAAQPAASTAGAGRSAAWGAFAFQAFGGSTGTIDGSVPGGPADGQPGSGRPRLRLPFRPVA